jgi:hypothetical protein
MFFLTPLPWPSTSSKSARLFITIRKRVDARVKLAGPYLYGSAAISARN